MGLENDLPPGEQLFTLFRPFLENLAGSDLSPKTLQKHVDNLWPLGREAIRDLTDDHSPGLRVCDPLTCDGRTGGMGDPILLVSSEQALANSSGVRYAKLLCGRSPLYSIRHRSIFSFASASVVNQL